MVHYTVKDLMVPISEYATVSLGTTLFDAVLVLERAQDAYIQSKYQHRAILVLDESGKVVGKISQLRILRAIEAPHGYERELESLRSFNFSDQYVQEQCARQRLDCRILTDEGLLAAAGKKVEEFMQQPTPGEYVAESCSLDVAIHKLVDGTHLSLLVTSGDEIVGVLRMADVFAALFHAMKTSVEQSRG